MSDFRTVVDAGFASWTARGTTMRGVITSAAAVLGLLTGAGLAIAEPAEAPAGAETEGAAEEANPLDQLPWLKDGTGPLGERARLQIPPGFRFAEPQTTQTILRAMGNIPDGAELGLVGPDDLEWFAIYQFSDIGYVEDDEKDELDPTEMLEVFREGTVEENEMRRAQGFATVEILGWAIPPRYDEGTNVLEWATRLRFTEPDGTSSESVNFKTKVLGRRGVMDVIVVCGPDELETVLPTYRSMMQGFEFVQGEKYAEFKPGDKIAEYGLAALVVGGATAVAAKAGLFAVLLGFLKKGGKLIVLGLAAIGAFFARMFGKRR